MKIFFALFALFAFSSALEWNKAFTLKDLDGTGLKLLDTFKAWTIHYNKKYDNVDTEARKFMVWLSNVYKIAAHNEKKESYTMGLNQFGDMTPEEFKLYIHGGQGSCLLNNNRPVLTGFRKVVNEIKEVIEEKKDGKPLASVDWTTKGVVTPVKNQGRCGSCWAFSTTGSIECQTAIKTGQLVSLSEQELVDCSRSYGNQGCNGGLMDSAFRYVKAKGGLCSESEYKYTAKDGSCKSCSKRYSKINGYTDVSRDNQGSLESAVSKGCVSIAIEADQSSFQFYRGGVLTAGCGTRLDHGVLAVGYGSSGGTEFWKVKNSWGSGWGESGYIRLCKNCGKNGGKGECGILMEPSYPTV